MKKSDSKILNNQLLKESSHDYNYHYGNLVIDSCALLSYLLGESRANIVEEILQETVNKGGGLYMSRVNLTEVKYEFIRAEESQELLVEVLDNLNIIIIDTDSEIADYAAIFKSKGKIALGDVFCLATAKKIGASVLTSDQEYSQFKQDQNIIMI